MAVPGIVDLSELAEASSGVAKVVLQGVQDMLLRVALQITSRTAESDSGKASTWPRMQVDTLDVSRIPKCMNGSLHLKAVDVALQRLLDWRGSASAR
ncbi:hypothetical protein ALP41_200172 [Pseudomonas savastanoi pv. nerii]|nr:hypothetical protein ALP41_200172 [Pseudomonas savastanoi pv. nerii]